MTRYGTAKSKAIGRYPRARPPTEDQRKTVPAARQEIAVWRNRFEASFGEITDLTELARHIAHPFLRTPFRACLAAP